MCRDYLQEALDAQRSARSGPTPKQSGTNAPSPSRAVTEWAAKLKWRITQFRSTYAAASPLEDLDLRLSAATLAIAEHRSREAPARIDAQAELLELDRSTSRDRRAEILRVRADTHYDSGNWSAALDQYREVLLRQPEQLSVLERVAECLYSLQHVEAALQAYADLAARLHDRGSRLLAQLDHRGAVQNLNKAATLRLWLFEQGRRELAADLAQSFSSCAHALLELQDLALAKVYLAHAIDIRTQLIRKASRNELAGELADNHARYAGVLFELGERDEALTQFGHAIDILGHLVTQGRSELRRGLAANFAHRGLVRQARGQTGAAAQDFQEAAEALALVGEFGEAVAWQRKALTLADEDKRQEAQLRLDHYSSGNPYHDSPNRGS
jgi:tetratricopeptide (TPR) repeat protein